MEKAIILLITLLSFSVIGCTKTEVSGPGNGIEELTGYIVIKDNTLHFDQIEIIEIDDKERIKELDLDEKDMPNGYAIINEVQEERTYELIDKVEYIFTDVKLNFIEETEGDRVYTTTKKDEFLRHLGDLNDIPLLEQRIPYLIRIQDEKNISIEERFKYTI